MRISLLSILVLGCHCIKYDYLDPVLSEVPPIRESQYANRVEDMASMWKSMNPVYTIKEVQEESKPMKAKSEKKISLSNTNETKIQL
jgi:hypothetical protein